MDEQALRAAEQTARLARIRAKIREGVWTLRENSALQAHWEALERAALAQDETGSTCAAGTSGNAIPFNPSEMMNGDRS